MRPGDGKALSKPTVTGGSPFPCGEGSGRRTQIRPALAPPLKGGESVAGLPGEGERLSRSPNGRGASMVIVGRSGQVAPFDIPFGHSGCCSGPAGRGPSSLRTAPPSTVLRAGFDTWPHCARPLLKMLFGVWMQQPAGTRQHAEWPEAVSKHTVADGRFVLPASFDTRPHSVQSLVRMLSWGRAANKQEGPSPEDGPSNIEARVAGLVPASPA
jgi:hypothetical protein